MKKGKLYSVGVGPGDPELLTAKAIRILSECDIVAVPQSDGGGQTALDIAAQYMKGKEIRLVRHAHDARQGGAERKP